ncbi:MAG: hypothetical protein VZR09_08130 [Candidatus Gastranaerophilaceae bacterium]|nr:hypothetical protein [Candidatus Gastranaerophilaceae bacterium]
MKTKPLIEQHIHGCFGIDFNKASVNDMLHVSQMLSKASVGGFFPTIVTDSIENTQRAINVIKTAAKQVEKGCAKILGIHLEGIFLNKEKKGIHNPVFFLEPTIDNYRLIEDDFIKIVTLAPELNVDLIGYLNSKGVKVQAGHCVGSDLSGCSGVTHLFNAMSGINHREPSTALSALVNDDIYTEIIADGVHVSDDALKLVFKAKPKDKILLVSDCLPCAYSGKKEFVFAGEKIYYDEVNNRATSAAGTLAGSTSLLIDIVKRLLRADLFDAQYIENPYNYHNIDVDGTIDWDEMFDKKIIN